MQDQLGLVESIFSPPKSLGLQRSILCNQERKGLYRRILKGIWKRIWKRIKKDPEEDLETISHRI